MLYYFLKLIVGIFTRIFYRNPLQLHPERVPVDTPLIMASNHPNALCDPCTLAVMARQRIHFLARGDVFKNKILYYIFVKHLGMVPIFRLLEGAENLHRNEESFRNTAEKLKQKKTILMFSEGICIQERRLRSLKKGTARIAFAAEESSGWKLGLKILPVGLNYNAPQRFRSDLVIQYGNPIEVASFKEEYLNDKAVAINKLTKAIHSALTGLVVHIESASNDAFVAELEEFIQHQKGIEKNKVEQFKLTEDLVRQVNMLGESADELKTLTKRYFSGLWNYETGDQFVKKLSDGTLTLTGTIFQMFGLALLFPVHLYGFINNYIPYKMGYFLARKLAKTIEFHATVHLYSSMLLYLIFYSLQALLCWMLMHDILFLLLYLISMPVSGLFSLWYYEWMESIISRVNLHIKPKAVRAKLVAERNELLRLIEKKINLQS